MSRPKLPPDFVRLCQAVTAKRPRTVINHILQHGSITTQELKEKYGYNHPPRAVTTRTSRCGKCAARTSCGVNGRSRFTKS